MKNGLIIDPKGNRRWYLNDFLHRENDLPAVEYTNGDKEWRLNGSLHREYGPAIIFAYGRNEWWINGVFQYSFNPGIPENPDIENKKVKKYRTKWRFITDL